MADYQPVIGGMPSPSEVLVTCDQETVVGDGSTSDPLRAPQQLSSLDAVATYPVGTPVKPTASGFAAAQADSAADAQVAGLLAVASSSGKPAVAQYGTTLTLTEAQWNAVTGGSSGLTTGSAYYLSAAAPGSLTTTAPSASGTFIVRVGVALSPTTMLVLINTPVGPHA